MRQLLLAFTLLLLPSISNAQTCSAYRCSPVAFAVKLSPTASTTYQVSGQFCADTFAQGKTIQVVLHGAGFDHNYWNWPQSPALYSYAQAAAAAGYAVLNIDRIGVGASQRPFGADLYGLSLHVDAYTVHQIVQTVRAGILVPYFGPVGYFGEHVMLVGHSLGSVIAAVEASTYNDVDGVIQSGISHVPGFGGIDSFYLTQQACLDPKFASLPCDPSTTPPSGIGYEVDVPQLPADPSLLPFPGPPSGDTFAFLFFAGNYDPAVVAEAEQVRQTFTAAEIADIVPSLGIPDPTTDSTIGIKVPTMLVNGQLDNVVCQPGYCGSDAALLANEGAHYDAKACLEARTVANTGHVLNLHTSASSWFQLAIDWSNRRVGSALWQPPTQPCAH